LQRNGTVPFINWAGFAGKATQNSSCPCRQSRHRAVFNPPESLNLKGLGYWGKASVFLQMQVLGPSQNLTTVCTRLANATIFDDTLAAKSTLIETCFAQPQAGETGR
jgi:hypothetical protein